VASRGQHRGDGEGVVTVPAACPIRARTPAVPTETHGYSAPRGDVIPAAGQELCKAEAQVEPCQNDLASYRRQVSPQTSCSRPRWMSVCRW